MTNEDAWAELLKPCTCENKYTIEPHGEGYALYYGRCNHRHGYNLVNMVEPAFNFEPRHIEKLINLGDLEYQKQQGFLDGKTIS
jgi:hypothetical protein